MLLGSLAPQIHWFPKIAKICHAMVVEWALELGMEVEDVARVSGFDAKTLAEVAGKDTLEKKIS